MGFGPSVEYEVSLRELAEFLEPAVRRDMSSVRVESAEFGAEYRD